MSDQITGYSVAGVIEADPNNEFVWVKFVDCQAAVAAARAEVGEDRVLGDVMAEHYRNKMSGPTQLSVSDEEEVYSLMQSYDRGFDAGVKAAREAVAAFFDSSVQMMTDGHYSYFVPTKDEALAAIDALTGGDNSNGGNQP